jgi:DNA (cytosine-5)-methyltransferase 1
VQWLSHGSTTHLQEICDPQELFLTDLCDSIDLRTIAGKATVHRCATLPTPVIDHTDYYYK